MHKQNAGRFCFKNFDYRRKRLMRKSNQAGCLLNPKNPLDAKNYFPSKISNSGRGGTSR